MIIITTFPLLTSAQAVSSYGVKYNITYDTSGNPLTSVVSSSDGSTDTITSSMTYQDNGNYPHTVTDERGNTATYTYDTSRWVQTAVTDVGGNTVDYTYNPLNDRLETVTAEDTESSVVYRYNVEGTLKQITAPSGTQYNFTYDAIGRQKQISVGTQKLSEVFYRDNKSSSVSRFEYGNGGNITEVKKNGEIIKQYGYTDENWKDKLTSYNGQTITYDSIGNPLNYRDNMTFTWANGRRLTGITQNGNALASYTYNADGLRTSKTVNGTTVNYYWINGVLQGQKTGDEYILFMYDENGAAYGFLLKNGTTEEYYYYIFNLQGDVILSVK